MTTVVPAGAIAGVDGNDAVYHYLKSEAEEIKARLDANAYEGDAAESAKALDAAQFKTTVTKLEAMRAHIQSGAGDLDAEIKSDAARMEALEALVTGEAPTLSEKQAEVLEVKVSEAKSAGTQFIESDEFKSLAPSGQVTKGSFKSFTVELEAKSLITSPSTPVNTRYENYAPKPLELLDVINQVDVGVESLTVHRKLMTTNAAAALSSDVASPESTFSWQTVALTVGDYGHHVPIDINTLNDHPTVEGIVNTELAWGVADVLETTILSDLDGTTGLLTEAFDTDIPTSVLNAITSVEVIRVPTAMAMNPADHNTLLLTKDTAGQYVGNGFVAGRTLSPWGLPVIRSGKVTAGFSYIGNFGSVIWRRRQNIEISTGWVNDQFTKRQVTMQAIARGFTDVSLPGAMIKADIVTP